jgi:hypothetical protein
MVKIINKGSTNTLKVVKNPNLKSKLQKCWNSIFICRSNEKFQKVVLSDYKKCAETHFEITLVFPPRELCPGQFM